jgi:putative ABC transport system ATP-binding protein
VDSAVLVAAGVTKTYGMGTARVEALRGIDLTLRRGEFVAVMGPSGSGKSSLLHLLAGLDRPSTGSIRIGGVDLAVLSEDERALLRRRQIGLMFQSFQLLDTLTAEENVALPLAIAGCSGDDASRRAAQMLGSVGLAHRRQHRPHELSGGEQQRVALARALVLSPLLLLADEPTGNLDSVQGDKIMTLLRQLVEERRQTLLMVTHDTGHAARADRIVHLRDGRIADELVGWAESSRPTEGVVGLEDSAHPTKRIGQHRQVMPVVRGIAECVEWSVEPPPCSFNAIAFVAPCAGDALEHEAESEEAA